MVDGASLVEDILLDLEAAERELQGSALSLRQAASECGYSVDHLARLVRLGIVPNSGRRNKPSILREDLPRKPGLAATAAPPDILGGRIAASVTHSKTRSA
jgi:hypothetical protein